MWWRQAYEVQLVGLAVLAPSVLVPAAYSAVDGAGDTPPSSRLTVTSSLLLLGAFSCSAIMFRLSVYSQLTPAAVGFVTHFSKGRRRQWCLARQKPQLLAQTPNCSRCRFGYCPLVFVVEPQSILGQFALSTSQHAQNAGGL